MGSGTQAIIHVGNTPLLIVEFLDEDGVALDISSATTQQILLEKPDGTVLTKTSGFTTDGTNGKIQYQAVIADFDVKGEWEIQGKVTLSGGSVWHTRADAFPVNPVKA